MNVRLEKMRYAVFIALLFLVGNAWSKDPTLPTEDSALLFEAGSEVSPRDLLRACALLSTDSDLTVRLRELEGQSSDLRRITFRSRGRADDSLEELEVTLRPSGPSVDTKEGVSAKSFENELKKFAEAANLTDQTPVIVLKVDGEVSSKQFRHFLRVLIRVFRDPIVIPSSKLGANKAK